jgi:hypothetical protein
MHRTHRARRSRASAFVGTRRPHVGRASGPIEQVYKSITSTLNTIGAVASPKSDIKLQHLSGPVGIGRIYYLLFQSERGWQLALWFSVILNVNLAILNMLPIPVLDGGQIVLAIIESIRRKPVNIRRPRSRADCLRRADHRLYGLRQLLRHRRPVRARSGRRAASSLCPSEPVAGAVARCDAGRIP